MIELLTPAQMAEADRLTIESGTPGIELMRAAGEAVASITSDMFPDAKSVLVISGSGNNGGDGFIAAQAMADKWRTVRVVLIGDASSIKGDARAAMEAWTGDTLAWSSDLLNDTDIIIDALLGAGLSRDADGRFKDVIDAVNASGKPVLAVDVPSGLDGATGAKRGTAIRAAATVTFFRKKPGHLLLPGRALCGATHLVDIGIAPTVLPVLDIELVENSPALWGALYPVPKLDGHKYSRGHAMVVSGPRFQTGAARLAAKAALRAGAGLVTIASPLDAADENAAHVTAIMLRTADGTGQFNALLKDERINALVLGPGMGVDANTRSMAIAALGSGRPCVLDADALTSFANHAPALGAAIKASQGTVLTPHTGEFHRLFGTFDNDKLTAARQAAKSSGAVIVFKGADTVIASPDGRAAINANAPPWLATAGVGDVLSGVAGAHLAMGMPPFEAACAAVWLHGRAGELIGPGLTAEDLDAGLRGVIGELVLGR